MPRATPRLYVSMGGSVDLPLTPEQANSLIANDLIYRCSVCGSGVHHQNDGANESTIREALQASEPETSHGRAFIPLPSAWQ